MSFVICRLPDESEPTRYRTPEGGWSKALAKAEFFPTEAAAAFVLGEHAHGWASEGHEIVSVAEAAVAEQVYGFLVTYECRTRTGIETRSFRSKGSEARARRAAALKTGCFSITNLEPFTREQWLRCFGEGRM